MSQPSAKESACPDCGEMVRVNSLRCWNCGAFMNSELEQRYMVMQANPGPVILSEVPASEMSFMDEPGNDEDEGGFRLNSSVHSSQSVSELLQEESSPAVSDDPDDDFPGGPVESEAEKSVVEKSSRRAAAVEENAVPHSVATGGDALLDIAIQEEREHRKRNKGRRTTGPVMTVGGGLIIYCPYGCRVEVKEQHRGMTGKCPRCSAPFIVPIDPPRYKKSAAATTDAAAAASPSTEKFKTWLADVHLHMIEPEKLKLKADSLLKEFVDADLGFSPEQLVVAILTKKSGGGGLFSKGGEKKETIRENMIAHLKGEKSIDELAVAEKFVFTADEAHQIRVIQPAASRGASLFHGIPVFGVGRIAIQLPLNDKMTQPTYLSFGITEFWKFSKAMEETFGISDLGAEEGVPMEARMTVDKCHFSDMLVKSLEDIEMFQADPTAQLDVVAYRCGACRTVVSEPARNKEKLGGKSPKGIAKAKCPKCGQKMGEHLLYALKQDVPEPSMNEAAGAT